MSHPPPYRGRIAPTPTGKLHLGHAYTFKIAEQRCLHAGGTLIYRDEDLDQQRCRPEYSLSAMEDLHWLGIRWAEGPDISGPHAPYRQSERLPLFVSHWEKLRDAGLIYPCDKSRKQLREYAESQRPILPDEQDAEPVFPPTWRPASGTGLDEKAPGTSNWRFRVPDGRTIQFNDGHQGETVFTAGKDFGDFLVWRRDGMPSYELAVVVDDLVMGITEVVRGADLLLSTARQLLLYEAFGCPPPAFFHTDLIRDAAGRRLAKRADSLSIAALRDSGKSPEEVFQIVN